MSKTSNYQMEPTELYSLAGPAVPSRMVHDEIPIYTAVSKPTRNVMTSQLQQPPLDDEIPKQQQQPTPNEKPHQQPQQIVPHQEPVKKTQIAIIIVMLLLILLALGVLLILVTAVLVTGNMHGEVTGCTCSLSDFLSNDEVNQKILQIVSNISITTDEQLSYHQNTSQSLFKAVGAVSDGLTSIEKVIENSTHLLTNTIAGTSSHLENTTAEVVGNVISEVDQIINTQTKLLFSNSCKTIKSIQPNSPTGYYHVNVSHPKKIFCNMGELCGSGGGWTRLAYLNMTDDTENCPSGFRLYNEGGVRACGRPSIYSGIGGCSSVKFPSNGISYSEICGRVVGYQYGPTDAVDNRFNNNINGAYVDGVSITRGSPREHVWTLMVGGSESRNSQSDCSCNNGSSQAQLIPSFIGSHYYCESGNPSKTPAVEFYPSDPLWDGEGCSGNESPCCSPPFDLPWFHMDYGSTTTTDYIELRVCGDEGTNDEDVPVGLYEIYVK